jgi:hypothetical protein
MYPVVGTTCGKGGNIDENSEEEEHYDEQNVELPSEENDDESTSDYQTENELESVKKRQGARLQGTNCIIPRSGLNWKMQRWITEYRKEKNQKKELKSNLSSR